MTKLFILSAIQLFYVMITMRKTTVNVVLVDSCVSVSTAAEWNREKLKATQYILCFLKLSTTVSYLWIPLFHLLQILFYVLFFKPIYFKNT